MDAPLVRCGFGLGNRVAAMANALSRRPEARFVWRVNQHLPCEHEEIFPAGVEGVEFVTDAPMDAASRFDGLHAETWEAAGDRAAADAAYGRIISAMAGTARACEAAVHFRKVHTPEPDVEALVAALAARMTGGRVMVMADSRRAEIAAAVCAAGFEPVMPAVPELPADKARTPEGMLAYLGDLKTLTACRLVVTHSPESSMVFPARAAGAEVVEVAGLP